ncbi:MAG: Gfo/Idh/MocA family oxidoreductase [Planctomycetaceae bacterium]|jgi:predicted dehydrogenase|nr:Gfo/Idh/MocA family oxidoreductase [Planctomycetaceae bacterium]
MNQKIKYALIGFGGIAVNRIAKEGFGCDSVRVGKPNNAELIGVTDVNPERKAAAVALGLKWYDHLETLLADPTIDAVFIATNNRSHASIAVTSLEAGKHVLVEKPLAVNSQEAKKLVELAQDKKLSLGVDHMMVQNVLHQETHEIIRDGKLGIVNDACFHIEFAYGYETGEAASWRCSDENELGGPIGDVASHCFYMIEFLFKNRIASVAAVYYPKTMAIKVEDGALIRLMLQNGLSCSVRVSFCDKRGGLGGTLTGLGFEIYGDKAVLRSYGTMFQLSGYSDEPIRQRLELDTFSQQENYYIDVPVNIYQKIIDLHATSILTGKPLNGEEGLHNVLLCEAAHRSAKQGGITCQIL